MKVNVTIIHVDLLREKKYQHPGRLIEHANIESFQFGLTQGSFEQRLHILSITFNDLSVIASNTCMDRLISPAKYRNEMQKRLLKLSS